MNYCIVAFGVILLIAGVTWILDGRKNYPGPYIEIEGLRSNEIGGLNPVTAGAKPVEERVEKSP